MPNGTEDIKYPWVELTPFSYYVSQSKSETILIWYMLLSISQKTILVPLSSTLQWLSPGRIPHGWIPPPIPTAHCCGTGCSWDVALQLPLQNLCKGEESQGIQAAPGLWWILSGSQARVFHAGSNVTANTNPITTSRKPPPTEATYQMQLCLFLSFIHLWEYLLWFTRLTETDFSALHRVRWVFVLFSFLELYV